VYFGKLVFESDEQEFSLRGVKSKKINSHPGRDVSKSVLKVRNADGTTVQVQMQDKISYCPAPLGRGATPYTVQYSGVPSVQLHTVIMTVLNASIVVRLAMCSGIVFHSRTVLGKNENL